MQLATQRMFRTTELSGLLGRVRDNHDQFTLRQRVALVCGNAALTAERMLVVPDADISAAFLRDNGVTARQLIAAGVRVQNLRARGATIDDCLALGFDALDVVASDVLATQFAVAYGEDACRAAFMRTPSDAVALAGSFAQSRFAISTQQLLHTCSMCEDETIAVLRQLGPQALSGVKASELKIDGVGAAQLRASGFSKLAVAQQLVGSPAERAATVGLAV